MFELEKSDDYGAYAGSINLNNGIISFSEYSYHIDSTGYVELIKEETKHLIMR